MTEMKSFSKFNCDICDKEVILHQSVGDHYDYYSSFEDHCTRECTAGFMGSRLLFCPECGRKTRKLIDILKKQGGSLIYFEKEGARQNEIFNPN